MKKWQMVFVMIGLNCSLTGWSQHNILPLNSYYKDKLFSPFDSSSFSNGSFLPVCESDFDLNLKIRDSSVQYYALTAYVYKKHLVELKGEDYYLTISPTIDLSYGKDKNEAFISTKFQNTRGFHIEGDLLDKVSFTTSFYENQARFTNYEKEYYLSVGELYPKFPYYAPQNAVIPGAARTKPFKTDAFDYAYAIGNVVYKPTRRILISGGNNAHFIGTGYRSLLLSDNSISAPYIQTNIAISDKWSFVYMRSRLFNLMRRPFTTSDESYYEPKGLSVNYLTYKLSKKINISMFEGGIWSKGDSITSTHVNPMFYNPFPFLSETFVKDKSKMSSLLGLNLELLLNAKHRLYGQLAMSNFDAENIGIQIGYRGYNFLRLKNMLFQMEYNHVPKGLYRANNKRLNYSHYNLPLAHTKGNGFNEFVLRANYEYQRFYVDLKVVSYQLENFQTGSLLPIYTNAILQFGSCQHEQIEVGYRFNRKVNLTLFGTYIYRNDLTSSTPLTKFFNLGIRTGLNNHYNDF